MSASTESTQANSLPSACEFSVIDVIEQDRVDAYLEGQSALMTALDELGTANQGDRYVSDRHRTINIALAFANTLVQQPTDVAIVPDGDTIVPVKLGSLKDMFLLAHAVDALKSKELFRRCYDLLVPSDTNIPPNLSNSLRIAYKSAHRSNTTDNGAVIRAWLQIETAVQARNDKARMDKIKAQAADEEKRRQRADTAFAIMYPPDNR